MKKIKLINSDKEILIDDSQYLRINKLPWKLINNEVARYTTKNQFRKLDKYLLRHYDHYDGNNTDDNINIYNNINIYSNINICHIDNNVLNNQFNNLYEYNEKAILQRMREIIKFTKQYVNKFYQLLSKINKSKITLTYNELIELYIYLEYEYDKFQVGYELIKDFNLSIVNNSYNYLPLIDKLFLHDFINLSEKGYITYKKLNNDKLKQILINLAKDNLIFTIYKIKISCLYQYINLDNYINIKKTEY